MKVWKFITSIERTLKDQDHKAAISIIGSFLVALSGLILFTDKVFPFELENKFGFGKTSTFIWVLSQTLSPILLIIASAFRPFKTAYIIPVYIYTIQFIWIFRPNIRFDDYYLQTYAIGTTIGFLLMLYIIYRFNLIKTKRQLENEKFKQDVNETIDLLKKDILTKTE